MYSGLPRDEMNEYDKLSQALLVKFSRSEQDLRKIFYNRKHCPGEITSQYLARLENLFDQWIKLSGIDNSYDKLREFIMRDKFLHSCPHDQAIFIRERTLNNISSLKELSEVFTASRLAVGISDQIKMTPVHRHAVQSKDRDPRPSPSFTRTLR